MKNLKNNTQVSKFVLLAWQCAGGIPHSWEAYNNQVRRTVGIALEGFQWEQYDVDRILSLKTAKFSILRCLRENAMEWMYSVAVRAANTSAYTEIERYLKRTPIIVDNVHGRQRDRICVGSQFQWEGQNVECTSFDGDGRAVCVTRDKNWRPIKKGGKRYRISRDDVIAARKGKES